MALARVCCEMDVFRMNDTCAAPEDLINLPLQSIPADMGLTKIVNVGNHGLLLAVTLALSWKCFQLEFKKTALHAYLCTVGFVFLLAEGLMVRYRTNVITGDFLVSNRTLLHVLFQFGGGALGTYGSLHKYLGKKKHFHTRHGVLGLAACILFLINLAIGMSILCWPGVPRSVPPVVMRLLHHALGTVTFGVGMLTQMYGYDTGFFRRNFTQIKLYKFLTFVVIALTVMAPLKMLLGKSKLWWLQR